MRCVFKSKRHVPEFILRMAWWSLFVVCLLDSLGSDIWSYQIDRCENSAFMQWLREIFYMRNRVSVSEPSARLFSGNPRKASTHLFFWVLDVGSGDTTMSFWMVGWYSLSIGDWTPFLLFDTYLGLIFAAGMPLVGQPWSWCGIPSRVFSAFAYSSAVWYLEIQSEFHGILIFLLLFLLTLHRSYLPSQELLASFPTINFLCLMSGYERL